MAEQDGAVAPGEKFPVVVVGAGVMGQLWVQMLAKTPIAKLVGLADLNLELANKVVTDEGLTEVVVGADLLEVVRASGAKAVINVTVPQAHRTVNEMALRAGLPVLCEKPIGNSLSDGLRQVALADVTGQLLMVSQSRRYFNHLAALRDSVQKLGKLTLVNIDFFRENHEPGFREEMAHPLLLDMSIHHFDAVRYVTGDEPVAVRCNSWNPDWSWYKGDATATADFELASGTRFAYAGSRCTIGLDTDWNGEWRVFGEHGAARWNGALDVYAESKFGQPEIPTKAETIEGSLGDFLVALKTSNTPDNEVRNNIRSFAMVEAAIQSSALKGERVVITDLLEQAYQQALGEEKADDVLAQLKSWGSAKVGINQGFWGN